MSSNIDIYVSYSREDRERVQRIVDGLQREGITCQIERPNRTSTASVWREELKAILGSVRCVLVVWSKHSINSDRVLEEADYGKRHGMLFHVFIDEVRPPVGLVTVQSPNLSSWKGDTENPTFISFLDAIKLVISQSYEQEEDSNASQLKSAKVKQHPDFQKDARIEPEIPQSELKSGQEKESTGTSEPKPQADAGRWFKSLETLVWGKLLRVSILAVIGLLCVYGSITLARLGLSAMEHSQPAAKQPQPCLSKPGQGPEMVLIPSGTFMMGSGESKDEQPIHQVTIQDFAIGRCEVTFEEYDRFAEVTGREIPSDEGWGRGNRPVINVSWEDSRAYAEWLSQQTRKTYRLPTEAEWEYAARAGSLTAYPWGNSASHEQANYGTDECCNGKKEGRDRWEFTAPVGEFPLNAFKLHDMHGNVLEWVEDCGHVGYTGAPEDGSAWLEANGGDCGGRVVRGGSWYITPRYLRSAYRFRNVPTNRYSDLGFRLVQDLSQ